MPSLVDFKVVASANVTLPNADDGINKEFEFDLESDTQVVRSHLLWAVAAREGQPTYTVTLNGTQLLRDTVGHPERRVMHVTTSGAIKPDRNTLKVERSSNSGSVNVDDIVIYYQRAV